MEKWIFTFGQNSGLSGYCQPIYAKSMKQAREKMFELHGRKWAFQYSIDKWEEFKSDPERLWHMEEELKPIYCEEVELDV